MTARKILALGAVAVVFGAGAAGAQEPTPSDMLLATLWNQRSVEYKGNALTVYALAKIRLDQALATRAGPQRPASRRAISRTCRPPSCSTSTRRCSTTRPTRSGC